MILDAVFLLASVFLEGQDLCSLLPVVLQALGVMGRLLSMRCEVFKVHIFQNGVNPFCLQLGLLIWAFVLRRMLKRKKSLGLSKCFLLEVANIIFNFMGGKKESLLSSGGLLKRLVLFLALIQGNKQVKDKEEGQKYQCWITYCL